MAYKALYRSFRPQSFKEVAGQEHITTTLKNALRLDKLSHSYIFSGPRGTGKTSIAKIVAKTVNCVNYPCEEPCNECDNCLGITNGNISDVVEMDAASNNSVDNIRQITDQVNYLPSVGKFKVYIIDEVHMLSPGAFNALLKTLEEPPAYVKFILATTEPHKIPSTIHSRCQRFDFRGISANDMIKKIKEIVEIENINIDEDAIRFIAESSLGGMRDALSLLDQCISYSTDNVTVEDVNIVSGNVSEEVSLKILDAIHDGNSVAALSSLNTLIEDGKEVNKIVSNLIDMLKDLLINKNIVIEDIHKRIFDNEVFIKLSKMMSNQIIYHYIDILVNAQNNIKRTTDKKTFLEIAFIKMIDEYESADRVAGTDILKLKKEINDLREQMKNIEFDPSMFDFPIPEKEKEVIPPFGIKAIEDVLNNGDKKQKKILIDNWDNLLNKDDPELAIVARELHAGTLAAIGNKKMLVIYDRIGVCNDLMQDDKKAKILKIFNSRSEIVNDFYALPKKVWDLILTDYITQRNEGIPKPILNDINLLVGSSEDDNDDYLSDLFEDKSEIVSYIKEFFNDDVLNIKEE